MSDTRERTRRSLRSTLSADRTSGSLRDLSVYLCDFSELEVDEVVGTWFAIRDGLGNEAAGVWEQDGDTYGPYQVVEELGSGGQAKVYRAIDLRLGRDVALKVLEQPSTGATSRLIRRFEREAKLASRLEHPGICTVYDVGVSGERPYIAMQLLRGQTLADEIGAGPLPPLRVAALGETMARALAHAHEQGVIHRDVKPSNIAITDAGQPVVMDFGIARPVAVEEDQPLTRAGELFGTPPYMSPEQISELSIRLDGRTDVWSLGVTLYECATGKLPFDSPDLYELFEQVRNHDLPTPDVPNDLRCILQAALTKKRERRYATAQDLADDLGRFRERRPVSVRSGNPLLSCVRIVQRNPVVAALTAIVILAAIVTLVTLAGR